MFRFRIHLTCWLFGTDFPSEPMNDQKSQMLTLPSMDVQTHMESHMSALGVG